jgi:hypothetical protein
MPLVEQFAKLAGVSVTETEIDDRGADAMAIDKVAGSCQRACHGNPPGQGDRGDRKSTTRA